MKNLKKNISFLQAVLRDYGSRQKLQESVACYSAFEDGTVSPATIAIIRKQNGEKSINTFHSKIPVQFENCEYVETLN